jgi:hypothetical protein
MERHLSGLEEAGASLRRAVDSGSYAEAQDLVAPYVRAMEDAAGHFPSGDTAAVEIIRQSISLLQGATRMVRAGRAHTALELARLSVGRPYRGLAAGSAPTFTLEG